MNSTLLKWLAVGSGVLTSVSCMTTYDSYGRPVQSVDPAAATAGIAAAGLIGYAVGQNNDDRHYYRSRPRYYGHHHHGYYNRRGYYR